MENPRIVRGVADVEECAASDAFGLRGIMQRVDSAVDSLPNFDGNDQTVSGLWMLGADTARQLTTGVRLLWLEASEGGSKKLNSRAMRWSLCLLFGLQK